VSGGDTRHSSGRHLGRYRLLQHIATGGMAEIFLAKEHAGHGLDRLVVIKKILSHLSVHETFVEMFLQEARIIGRLTHPNIVQIHELGEADGAYYIAMEYVSGVSFRELMRDAARKNEEISFHVIIGLIEQACAGLHAAHELTDEGGKNVGLVHRDISPHNLMVTAEGHVKLLDFGIAKPTEQVMEETRTGALKGKVNYMSPEQCQQRPLDRRSDIFALGVVLWELITARRLFKRDSELTSMQAIVDGEIWDPKKFRLDTPEELSAISTKALAKDKNERYQTAEEMRLDLLRVLETMESKRTASPVKDFIQDLFGDYLRQTNQDIRQAMERSLTLDLEGEDATLVDRPLAKTELIEDTGSSRSFLKSLSLPFALTQSQVETKTSVARRFAPTAIFLLVSLFVAAGAVAGWIHWKENKVVVAGEPITIGWPPIMDPASLASDLAPLRTYLQKVTGRPFRFVMAKDYKDLSEKLLSGEIAFGSFPPYLFLTTQAKNPKIKMIALKLIEGSSGSDGVLLVTENAGVSQIQDLKGKTLCYSDENSTSGYVLPRMTLRKSGLDPDVDVKMHSSGNHLQSLRDLSAGICQAAGTYSGAYLSASRAGVNVAPLRVLQVTGRTPQDTIVAGSDTDKADRHLVREALLAFKPMQLFGTRDIGEIEKISGFTIPAFSDFAALREALREDSGLNAPSPTREEPK
jgi:eukaryotic-like serine/threonine-protein kinase